MALMLIAALGALLSFFGSVGAIGASGADAVVAESWRAYGFLVFAGLFLLLALRPRLYPGVWELAILHKTAMALTATALLGGGAANAPTAAVADGALALVLVASYALTRGYSGWAGTFFRGRRAARRSGRFGRGSRGARCSALRRPCGLSDV